MTHTPREFPVCNHCGQRAIAHHGKPYLWCAVCKQREGVGAISWPHDPRTTTREEVRGVDWGTGSETVHSLWERGGKRLDWVAGGPVLRQEGDWEPGEVEELVSPAREEFSAWLERDGLREER